ncbi:MAG: PQQ-binding-like beta-propeller repeat protein, partial [bacterium]|nr:PQQ-binding-like beta-propeller repeat protein [bacterium]
MTAPSFGLATGDLTEYGVIDDTFSVFEAAFAPLPIPLYVVPGNHDNTWVAMYEVMRRRHGGENYSFEQSGCHFVCLCTASPQEPVPTIDAKTRAWLRRDLARVAPGTPIFVALHHPPYSGEFAAPAEYDTFIDRLKDFNVVLLLYGHGHAVDHRRMDGIDGVMGGSTFGKNAGYNLVSVRDGRLRVQYHYHHNAGGSAEAPSAGRRRTLLDKPIRRTVPQRLFRIHKPRDGDTARQDRLDIALQMAVGERAPAASNLSVRIDGEEVEFNRTPGDQPAGWRVDVGGLTPGGHLLTVRLTTAEGGQGHVGQDLRTRTFFIDRDPIHPRWRVEFPAAVKAGPVVVGDHVVVARTDGVVVALDRRTGQVVWTFATGGEILGTPAWSGQLLVFGSGDGSVYALDESGQRVWVFEAGAPVYGPPLIDAGLVFIGDNGGRLHALDLGTGRPRWTFERADYAIESQPHRWGDLVVFGAWDGYLYAVQRRDAELAWKVPGPKSSEGKGVRYYAPADCGPVALGELLFGCGRGYRLGAYSADGAPGDKWLGQVSAIAPDASGQYL